MRCRILPNASKRLKAAGVVWLSLPPGLKEKLDEICSALKGLGINVNRSQFIRNAVEKYLAYLGEARKRGRQEIVDKDLSE